MDKTTDIEVLLAREALTIEERRAAWAKHRALLLPILRGLEKLGASVSFPNSLDFSLSGDKHTLAAAIRVLRTSGFATDQTPPKKGDSAWHAFYRSEACDIEIWFTFSSTVCRRVLVGMQMVEQPVYETVCDELILPDTAAA